MKKGPRVILEPFGKVIGECKLNLCDDMSDHYANTNRHNNRRKPPGPKCLKWLHLMSSIFRILFVDGDCNDDTGNISKNPVNHFHRHFLDLSLKFARSVSLKLLNKIYYTLNRMSRTFLRKFYRSLSASVRNSSQRFSKDTTRIIPRSIQ